MDNRKLLSVKLIMQNTTSIKCKISLNYEADYQLHHSVYGKGSAQAAWSLE